MEWLDTLIGAVSGGALATLLTLPSIIKKAKAEARAADITNMQQAIDGWHQIADERQQEVAEVKERCTSLDDKIDTLYDKINEWRDKFSAEQIINAQLRIEIEKNKIRLCEKAGCQDRTPPTGF